jgi:lipopolysaccharide transport system ATP-binding protein
MNHPLTHDALFTHVADDGDYAIRVENVFKRYAMFKRPEDRLKQMIVPRLQRAAMLEAKSYYKEFSAVSDVSLNVRRGETIGIIGRNGSGKSTLLQMIVGTLTPTSGNVKVNGRIAALLELGAGFNPEFTGRENVYVNGAILGFSRAEMDERFEAIAAFANIGEFIERPVKTYSSGMFVRLAFAVATAVEPDILVVDEALSVGDEAFQRKCFARIEAIKERGGTILFVSHGAQTIVQLCDRAILLEAGEKLLEGDPKAVVGQYQRLVNASDEGAAKVKAEILAMGGLAQYAPITEATSALAIGTDTNQAVDEEDDGLADYFDPNLRSESVVHLEQRGAVVRGIVVKSLNGEIVNFLHLGRRYVCEYYVDFETSAKEVGFGFWLRTVTGVGLGGGQTIWSKKYRTPHIRNRTTAKIRYEFDCCLLPGVYFISCGLFGIPDGSNEQIIMHRIIDAFPIRVLPQSDLLASGLVYFRPTVNVDLSLDGTLFETV